MKTNKKFNRSKLTLNEILLHMLGLTTPIDIKYFSKAMFTTSMGKVKDLMFKYL